MDFKDDLFERARSAISEGLITSLFSHPKAVFRNGKNGREYCTVNPLRDDGHVSGFAINCHSGLWNDITTGQSGDFVDLVSMWKGIGKKDAANLILGESGNYRKTEKIEVACELPEIITPIPENGKEQKALIQFITNKWAKENRGKATDVYRYKDREGNWLFAVVRFEKWNEDKQKNDKITIPYYYSTDNKWIAKRPDQLFPFLPYGIENYSDGDDVLIVEGEKCGKIEVEGWTVLSWFGGSNRANETDWRILKTANRVVIWPDADSTKDREENLFPIDKQPGIKASLEILKLLPDAEILNPYMWWPIENDPKGLDIVDYVEGGFNPVTFITECTRYSNEPIKIGNDSSLEIFKPETKQLMPELSEIIIDPFLVYRNFIDFFYYKDCLDQSGGVYWNYSQKDHYWSEISEKDIHCNMQRWLEKSGIHEKIARETKAPKFFNDMKSYIRNHSNDYVFENPFKDAANNPYIHVENGALQINRQGIDFIKREDKGEKYFQNLFPLHCMDFDFDPKFLKGVDPQNDCPSFWHFIKGLVPEILLEGKSIGAKERLYRECLMFVAQIFAYSLSPVKPNQNFFCIQGNEGTGKSFFISILKSFIGSKFCVERPITNMKGNFASYGLWGKKVYIDPDVKRGAVLPDDFIKSYAGEVITTVEPKNVNPIDGVKMSMSLFFVSNYDFIVKGVEGIDRRLILIPYENKLENPDRFLLEKIIGIDEKGNESGDMCGETFDERPAILGLVVEAWKMFIDNNFDFTVPEWAEKAKSNWLTKNSSVLSFFKKWKSNTELWNVSTSGFYTDYKDWCIEENRKPLGKRNFIDEFERGEFGKLSEDESMMYLSREGDKEKQ